MKNMRLPRTFVCILLLLLQKSNSERVFNDDKTLSVSSIGWMADLDDNKLLSEITIPGTHDALALHGGSLAECQAWSLEDQLNAGIRYFDLEVSGEDLKIKHGITYQHITFTDVLKTIEDFLSKYQKEIVLVRVEPVFFHEDKVPDLVKNKINQAISWVSASIPTIGEVRGKIVYVQKDIFTLGVRLTETDENGDYKVTDVGKKFTKIQGNLANAKVLCSKSSLVLNYSSGTGVGTTKGLFKALTPKRVAEKINPLLFKYLQEASTENPKPCFGIIAMDFPGVDLIQKVIDLTKLNE